MIIPFRDKMPKIDPSAFISPLAFIAGDVEIGEYANVWPGAVIRGDYAGIRVGRYTSIQDNCVLHTDLGTEVGDFCLVGHNAVIEAKRVGSYCLVGIHAVILKGVQVGDYCIIGANALLTEGMVVPDRSLVLGSPAKVRGPLSQAQMEMLKGMGQHYAGLAQEYKRGGFGETLPTGR